jgi:hypothetical protein
MDAERRSPRHLSRRRVLGATIRSTGHHADHRSRDAAAGDERGAATCRSERSVDAPSHRRGRHRRRRGPRVRGRLAELLARLCRGRGATGSVREQGNTLHDGRSGTDGLDVPLRGVQPRHGLRRGEPLRDPDHALSGPTDPRHVSAGAIEACDGMPRSVVVARERKKSRRRNAGSCRFYPRNIRGW